MNMLGRVLLRSADGFADATESHLTPSHAGCPRQPTRDNRKDAVRRAAHDRGLSARER
jgi:hypothetical protein